MVGKHSGHCFLVGADGLGQVLFVRIGPAFSVSPVFQLNKDRTDFPEPSRRRIATHRSLLRLSSETGTFGVVSGSAAAGLVADRWPQGSGSEALDVQIQRHLAPA